MIYDCIIIGGGISGLSAAIYLANANQSILIIDDSCGGNILNAPSIRNYPGFKNITGIDLIQKINDQCINLKITCTYEKVDSIQQTSDYFYVNTSYYGKYYGKTIIIATGTKHKELDIPIVESKVHYCALCDGEFYKDKIVAVIGGGNSALSSAIYLKRIGATPIIYCRSKIRAVESLIIKANELSIDIIQNTKFVSIDHNVLSYKDPNNNSYQSAVSGVFVCIGQIPNIDCTKSLKIKLGDNEYTKLGYIETGVYHLDYDHMTNINGVFACGSVIGYKYDQAIIAAGDGATCGLEVINYLNSIS